MIVAQGIAMRVEARTLFLIFMVFMGVSLV
jgi:hypothetical protein